MGLYDAVEVGEGVELPHFPEDLDPSDEIWQTKGIGHPSMATYRITSNGRLEERRESRREKTGGEKQQEAEKWGFDSWDEYVAAYDNHDNGIYPDEIDPHSIEDEWPPILPSETTLDDRWWDEMNYTGSFEFYASGKPINGWPDIFFTYEARFTKGELDGIVFCGERGRDTREAAIDELDDWSA